MTRLPVIVGFGGINPAGRSSGHHGYRRMVYDALDASKKASTIASLSALMGRSVTEEEALASTLIRKLEHNLFDPNYYRANRQAEIHGEGASPLFFKLKKNQLPELKRQRSMLGGGSARGDRRSCRDEVHLG